MRRTLTRDGDAVIERLPEKREVATKLDASSRGVERDFESLTSGKAERNARNPKVRIKLFSLESSGQSGRHLNSHAPLPTL